MSRSIVVGLLGTLGMTVATRASGLAAGSQLPAGASETRAPATSLIQGVPFIAWREAAGWNYPRKDVLNPSVPAATGMILRYWGEELRELDRFWSSPALEGWVSRQGGEAKGLDELKALVARGIPVEVAAALTPVAHPLAGAASDAVARGVATPEELGEGGPYSGALGRMASLAGHRFLRNALGRNAGNTVSDSLTAAHRVVIGYDDAREVVILHDPSCGPAYEIGYEDFDRMWTATDRWFSVLHPEGYAELLAARPAAPAYRERTPDEQAVAHFVLGYALSSVGRLEEGKGELEEGLALTGIGRGYQHLLLFELALNQAGSNHQDEAIATARRAIEVLPENPGPWAFLADLHRRSGAPDGASKAEEAGARAEQLSTDGKAWKTVAEVLPRDVWLADLNPFRGWGDGR